MSVIPYRPPERWLIYDKAAVQEALGRAEEEIRLLQRLPHLRDQAEAWRATQLRREAEGTSRIEGAEFTEAELDAALAEEVPVDSLNHSQRQARSAERAYRWIAGLDMNQPVDDSLILNIHRQIIRDCDDKHCEPGVLRKQDHNVIFGTLPQHRGVEGGDECVRTFAHLMEAASSEFREHSPLICAHALHYHLAAMHPFGDGNGRTARATEAFMLQKAGLRDVLFVALSNYYYENKDRYLSVLSEVRQSGGNLTPFLLFALEGVRQLCRQLANGIIRQLQKSLFRECINELSDRLISKRRRVLSDRQIIWLNYLLDQGDREVSGAQRFVGRIFKGAPHDLGEESAFLDDALKSMGFHYVHLKKPVDAMVRDIRRLRNLGAIKVRNGESSKSESRFLEINLSWPEKMRTHEFQRAIKMLPQTRLGKKRSPRRRP